MSNNCSDKTNTKIFGEFDLPNWFFSRPGLCNDFIALNQFIAPCNQSKSISSIIPDRKDESKPHSFSSETTLDPSSKESPPNVANQLDDIPFGPSTNNGSSSLIQHPFQLQERLLIQDLLYAMIGIQGRFIVMKETSVDPKPSVKCEEIDKFDLNHAQLETIDSIPQAMPSSDATNAPILSPLSHIGHHEFKWIILPQIPLNPSLISLAERILPLGEYYVEINKFIDDYSHFSCGRIAHALTDAISTLIHDYLILIAQLEQLLLAGNLSIQKMWYCIQTTLETMQIIRDISRETIQKKKRGGELLNLLVKHWHLTHEHKPRFDILNFLLKKASIPYWEMLESWITKGLIDDPYDEFMVQENPAYQFDIQGDMNSKQALAKEEFCVGSGDRINHHPFEPYHDSWNNKYTLRSAHILLFFEKVTNQILMTGKYINIVRSYHKNLLNHRVEASGKMINLDLSHSFDHSFHVNSANVDFTSTSSLPSQNSLNDNGVNQDKSMHFTLFAHEQLYIDKVDFAYQLASGRLLHLIRSECGLISKLQTIKSYFLLAQGDFFVHFMDLAESELRLAANLISPTSLQMLFELAIRMGSKDEIISGLVHIKLLPYNLLNQLIARYRHDIHLKGHIEDISGFEALTLHWRMTWPLSLIFNQEALEKYQILFRHLFYCRYVGRALERSWTLYQLTKKILYMPCFRSFQMPISYHTHSHDPDSSAHLSYICANLKRCFALHQRMLHLIQNIQYYMQFEIIDPLYHRLEEAFLEATTIEELIESHHIFLVESLSNCLLTEMNLTKIITKLMSICLSFCNYSEQIISALTQAQRKETSSKAEILRIPPMAPSLQEPEFENNLIRFETNFDKYIQMLMSTISSFQEATVMTATNSAFSSPQHLVNLSTRLDYNQFYSSSC